MCVCVCARVSVGVSVGVSAGECRCVLRGRWWGGGGLVRMCVGARVFGKEGDGEREKTRERERERDTETETETDRRTDRQTDRQTECECVFLKMLSCPTLQQRSNTA